MEEFRWDFASLLNCPPPMLALLTVREFDQGVARIRATRQRMDAASAAQEGRG